jgi:23S rRNA (adenine2030-N6)-methyltransferase
MHGSGVFVINPPWTLQASLEEAMPWLVKVLGLDAGAAFTLESQAS